MDPATKPNNRAGRRMRSRARYYDSPTDFDGKPFTAKGVKHRNGSVPFTPSKDPKETNHERVVRQRLARKLRLSQ